MRRQVGAGATVVSVLHDLSLAFLADRLTVMSGGRVHAEGAREDPALHEALREVFGGAIRVERLGARLVAIPDLED